MSPDDYAKIVKIVQTALNAQKNSELVLPIYITVASIMATDNKSKQTQDQLFEKNKKLVQILKATGADEQMIYEVIQEPNIELRCGSQAQDYSIFLAELRQQIIDALPE